MERTTTSPTSAVPRSLLLESQQRAGLLSAPANSSTLQQQQQQQYQCYQLPRSGRCHSAAPAPFRLGALHRLTGLPSSKTPVAKPDLTARAASPTQSSCCHYSTDNLHRRSTPQRYPSRSAGSSPVHGEQQRDNVTLGSGAGIAAAWLTQQQQQPTPASHVADAVQQSQAAHDSSCSAASSAAAAVATETGSHQDLSSRPVQAPHPAGVPEQSNSNHVLHEATTTCEGGRPCTMQRASTPSATAGPPAAAPACSNSEGSTQEPVQPPSTSYDTCTTNSSSTSTSRAGVLVFSRNKAVQLESELQLLPPGQLLAAQQECIQRWSSHHQQLQQQLQACLEHSDGCVQLQPPQTQLQQQPSVCAEVLSSQLVPWQQQISRLMQQLIQQVAYNCVEHGRTLEVLQQRYAELANCLFLGVTCLSQQHAALSAAAQATAAALADSRSRQVDLQQKVTAQHTAAQELQEQLALLTAQHEALMQDTQQTVQQLQTMVVSLKQQLWQARNDHEQQAAAAEAAAAREAERRDRQMAEADAEADSLRQRLAFVHEQLRAAKEQLLQVPEVACAAVQTDPVQPEQPASLEQPQEPPAAEASSEASDTELSSEETPDEAPRAITLLEHAAAGHKRSKLWVVKLLGQLAADKAVADAVADRQGLARASLQDFLTNTWALNRYGLQHLCDQLLDDLCASLCHHAAAGVLPARWFACLLALAAAVKPKKQQRLLETWQPLPTAFGHHAGQAAAGSNSGHNSGSSSMATTLQPAEALTLLGSPAAADFFVFVACQLAYPNSVVALFPEAQEAVPAIRSSLVMEALKAAFRYLGDPAGQAHFVATKLEAAVTADGALLPPSDRAATSSSTSRPGTSFSTGSGSSGSVLGRFCYYNAWVLLDLLLEEWLARAWQHAVQQGEVAAGKEEAGAV